eukprot:13153099-Alexandrium_andersonii.AAC.1
MLVIPPRNPKSASGAPAGPLRRQIRNLSKKRAEQTPPSRALEINSEVVPGPTQFKVRTPQSISYCLGRECSTAIGISENRLLGVHAP